MRNPVSAFLLNIAILLSVSIGPAYGANIWRSFSTIHISGEIVPGDYDRLREKLNEKPSAQISIKSPGGNTVEALRMAKLLRDAGSVVSVSDYCASACAQYIFLLAKRRLIEGKGFVALHAGVSGTLRTLIAELQKFQISDSGEQAILEENIEALKSKHRQVEREIRQAYQDAGVDPRIYDVVGTLTAPRKIEYRVDVRNRQIEVFREDPPPCDWWVPSASALEKFGVATQELDVNMDQDHVSNRLNRLKSRIHFGGIPEYSSAQTYNSSCARAALADIAPSVLDDEKGDK